jgi:threonine dehydrogenase-like Zn-dependent dehydrogenase
MRAAVISAPGACRTETVGRPEPGPGEVRIRLEGSGVCGSTLPFWEGRPWFQYPGAPGQPGHEGWGVIDAIGPGVDTLAPGDRVSALTYRAHAEYDLAPSGHVVSLPPALKDVPFPGEPLACAVNAFRRSGIQPGTTVAIIGIGFLGALLTKLASLAGARVIALSRRRYALEVAQNMGAEVMLRLGDSADLVSQVQRLTDGNGCDTVIEAIGLQEPLDLAAELVRVRGRLVIAGYHQDGLRQINLQLWNWRGIDVINAHERDPTIYIEGMREAARLVADGSLDPRPLYTDRVDLGRLGDAMDAMQRRPDGFLKALVTV